jgi:uncharacterized membrane protein
MPEPSNPYAAPASRVDDIAATSAASRLIPDGRKVPAGHGWEWLAAGWDLFKRNPGTWILIGLIFFGILMLSSWVPVIGFVASSVLSPVLLGGAMLGCASLEQGGSIEVSHLFAGFREKTTPLVMVGVLYLAGLVAILLVVGVMFGFSMIPVFLGQAQPDVGAALQIFMLAVLVTLALSIPLWMALWFAAPLVMLHDMKPVDAFKASFLGCIKNIVPFLIYGLISLLAMIVATLPLFLGWLLLGPVLIGSIYAGYRDIFTETAQV